MNSIKERILNEIQNNVNVFIKVSPIQYRIRCPFCGDSQKNLNEGHLYIKCSSDPIEPLLFNCFKCNTSGKITQNFLDRLNIKFDDKFEIESNIFNKISSYKKTDINIITGTPLMNSKQTRYIGNRLGNIFTKEDFEKFKIVWNIETLLPYISNIKVKHILPTNNDSISFLSDDKSTLITRFFSDEYPRWKKIKLFSSNNKTFYTIKNTLDLFTKDEITVNIAEGIFDVMSIYKNFNTGDNSIYLAVLGSDYESGIEYIIKHGIIGKNVNIKIYLDSNINEKFEKPKLKVLKWLFNKITILKNIEYEDIGTSIDNIKLIEYEI